MGRFLVRLFAVIGVLAVLLVVTLAGVAWWAAGRFGERATIRVPAAAVLVADWRGGVQEKGRGLAAAAGLPFPSRPALPEVLLALQRATADPRVKALVVRTDGEGLGLAQAQELHAAVRAFRAAGKPTFVYADTLGEFGGGMVGTYLAAAFEHVQLQPLGTVGLTGLAVDQPYVGRLLEELDVEFQVAQREAFKSALEPLTRSAPSPEQTATLARLLDAVFSELVDGIADARGLAPEAVRRAVDQGPLLGPEALAAGLIDAIDHEDALWRAVDARAGAAERLELERYARTLGSADRAAKATIGFVHAVGPIRRGTGEGLAGDREIAGDALAEALDAAREAEVGAVVLRIDSPGGSAVASETAAGAIRRLRAAGIPLVASMGGVAASGGYWLAMDADRILASPLTLTGSIGVIAGKPAVRQLLEGLGVDVVSERRGTNAGFGSLVDPWDEAALARLDALLDDTYAQFLQGVARGRGMTVEAVRAVAGGQVWTGREALGHGLVDDLGGLLAAVDAAKALAGVEADDPVRLRPFPEPQPPWVELLRQLDVVDAVRELAAAWRGVVSDGAPVRAQATLPALR